MEECAEVGCVHPATKNWNGRLVCDDHFDYYREELERIRREMY